MPQYQRQKQGQARVRILPKDATRAYLLMMKHSGGGTASPAERCVCRQ